LFVSTVNAFIAVAVGDKETNFAASAEVRDGVTAVKKISANFAAAVDPPVLSLFHLLPDLRRATDQRC